MYLKINFILILLFFQGYVSGQSYFMTGGIRLGTDYGLTFKQRILKRTTVEAILFSNDNGKSNLGFSLMAANHKPILTRNFNLFYGTGLTWQSEQYESEAGVIRNSKLGIPIQAGIELTVGRINLSWDFTPILYISTNSNGSKGPLFNSLKGLSVRYVFLNKKEGKRLMKKVKSPFSKSKK